jgi:uncharacterized Zn finger protein
VIELSEPPAGYEWELSEENDPMFAGLDGKTYVLTLTKDGNVIERRGTFVPANQMDNLEEFVRGLEESIRESL